MLMHFLRNNYTEAEAVKPPHLFKEVKMTKDKWINIRCTEEQRKDVTEFAKECNMAVSELFWYLVAKEREDKSNERN